MLSLNIDAEVRKLWNIVVFLFVRTQNVSLTLYTDEAETQEWHGLFHVFTHFLRFEW